ncbi:hypothetical protein F4813DRAFT_395201 [Daldinia decipiens]|uniref:uncharacterized protein n=1 Tax=Daldinia decipiens TaxID=326647 RepID=UPI0020C4C9F2|nr:uncharacterized protein F4813DRAFT_395201 [Daldinia decipiens]KAI1659282.1 hypothetical protein F4813DRAFT_395201 [Daldinia decipiens]
MDPFAAIGLAGNIITFVEFGFKLISLSKNIYESKSGASEDNKNLSSMTGRLQQLTAELKGAKQIGSSRQNSPLYDVATECEVASVELMKLLDQLKAKDPNSRRHAFKAAIHNWRKSDQKSELEKRLDRCKQQLGLELLSSIKSDSLERLDRLLKSGQASKDELQSLSRNIEALRQGTNVSCLSTEALGQIRSLVQLSDEAILKTRQARVLDALRFQLMNERFEDIEEAHERTFDWIFDISATDVVKDDNTEPEMSDDDDEYPEDHSDHEINNESHRSPSYTSQRSNKASKAGSIRSTLSSDITRPVYTTKESGHDSSSVTHDLEEQLSDSSSLSWGMEDDRLSIAESENSVKLLERPRYASKPLLPVISSVEEMPESTCQVMTEARDNFITWLKKGTGIFHISGKPGSGKSTLMKYLVRHLKTKDYLEMWADKKKLVLGRFFFWKPGSALQKNTNGLIRGLLHCLLSECPELVRLAFPEQWEESMHRENVHVEHCECRQAFERLMENQTYGQHKFVLFIDGLDEFEGHHADLTKQLVRWSNGTQDIKLCISSREWPIFQDAFKNCPRIRLHDITRSDIQRFVRDRLREMNLDALVRNSDSLNNDDELSNTCETMDLEGDIVRDSDGVFLWVSLVLRHIENGIADGDRIQDLIRLVRSLPTDLEPMLKQLLDSIPTNNRRLAYSMLSLASFVTTHGNQICLMQYSFLEEYIENRNFAIDWPVRLFTTSEHGERLERSKRRVYGVCKGLLELREPPAKTTYPNMLGDVVRLIHRSIAEFLESQHFKAETESVLKEFDPFDAFCQTYLGQLKRIRLPMAYFSPKLFSLQRSISWGNVIEDSAGFFYYPSHPTFQQDILWIVCRQNNREQHRARPRFSQFLDHTCRTVASLRTRPCMLRTIYDNRVIQYPPENVIIIICILIGIYENLPLEADTDSEMIDLCASWCLFDIGQSQLMSPHIIPSKAIRVLQTFLDRGASPDSVMGHNITAPEFHHILKDWCILYTPSLAVVALMLYHGVNPRFAIVISRGIYQPRDLGSCILKARFRSECPSIQKGNEARKIQLGRDMPFLTIEASPQTLRMISNHGCDIDLRALVSVWFPDQSHILQPAIDYILELGVLTNAHHRSELQSRFGPLLRPLFDQDHPHFVGEVLPRTEWPQESIHWDYHELDSYRLSKIEEAQWWKQLEVEESTATSVYDDGDDDDDDGDD